MPASSRHAIPLSDASLDRLGADVARPEYDRRRLEPGVAHIGVGGFHRSHQASYFDGLAAEGEMAWGIRGVNLRSARTRDALAPQDHLYTLVERSAAGERARVIGALSGCVFAGEHPAAAVATLADPRVRLVTLTITGDGYERAQTNGAPQLTAFDLIAAALARRRMTQTKPFTVLSCDNLAGNGEAARKATVRAARAHSLAFADWIEAAVSFPNSVVDRITPETTPLTREHVAREFGVDDRAPVVAEPFSQWVIEDDFCDQRPPLDLVGARFVADVGGYARAKRRLLNGGHSALGYIGFLLGHRTTYEAMEDPLVCGFLDRLLSDEIAPLLSAPAGLDLDEYRRTLLERFANPKLGDQLSRLCGRGSTKVPAYLLPSAAEALRRRRPYSLLALTVAAWIRYLRGFDLSGEPIEIRDAQYGDLRPVVLAAQGDPVFLLRNRTIFGDLSFAPAFADALREALHAIDRNGLRETIDSYVRGESGALVMT